MQDERPQKPRFQFSLRTSLIAVLIAGLLLFVNIRCSFSIAFVVNTLAIAAASIAAVVMLKKMKRGEGESEFFNAIGEAVIYTGILLIFLVILRR